MNKSANKETTIDIDVDVALMAKLRSSGASSEESALFILSKGVYTFFNTEGVYTREEKEDK